MTILLSVIRLIPIDGTRVVSEWLRRDLLGYGHHGSLVFLSAPPNRPDDDGVPFARLSAVQSPDVFWRVALVIRRLVATWGKALPAHAQRRNR